VLLVGEAPWVGDNDFKVMESIARGDPLRFRNSQWKKVSGQAKNLITRMLSRKVPDRPSAAMVMEDVWFTERLLKRKLDKNE